MKYKYPRISNLITYQKLDAENVLVKDIRTDEVYTFDIEYVKYVLKLDGFTHPYDIPTVLDREEINYVIDFLECNDLTRQNNVLKLGHGNYCFPLFMFGKISKKTIKLARCFNLLLLLTWLPIFLLGIIMYMNIDFFADDVGFVSGTVLGFVLGIILHEFGHALASLAYKAPVFEFGLLLKYFIIPGAYVMSDHTHCKKRLQRVQIFAAGVEFNFLLCGAFMIAASLCEPLSSFFFYAAFSNGILATLNLLFGDGLDGCSIMAELLGVEYFIDKVKYVVFEPEVREELVQQGVSGIASLLMCYVMWILQICFPIIIVTNILGVLSWIL